MDSVLDLEKCDAPGKLEKLQRNAYLSGKGIDPNGQYQLDFIFSDSIKEREDHRFIPNDYARSSMFTARNKRTPRKILLHEKLFHLHEGVSILYTGIELRAEDDEIIWLQILNYGRNVPLGNPFCFSIKQLVLDVGWSKNGRYYDKARECISRLKANEVLALNKNAYGTSGAISLIANYSSVNDSDGKPTHYRVWIDPNLIILFAGNTFTTHAWAAYQRLSPVARRLADYLDSHQYPFPLNLEKFRQMCGSNDVNIRSWRQTVKKACKEIELSNIATRVILGTADTICCIRE